MKNYIYMLALGLVLIAHTTYANNSDTIKLFPIEDYSQNVDEWLNPNLAGYNLSLLDEDYQQQRFNQLKHTYFGTSANDASPWSRGHVEQVFNSQIESRSILLAVKSSLASFDNGHQDTQHIVYGMNFRPYSIVWWNKIAANIAFEQFKNFKYNKNNRAISVINLALRGLPSDDPAFYNYKLPGEGYPFDNLAISSVYAGTPLYILATTIDRQWNLIMAPEYIGWVKADGVAKVDDKFVRIWQQAAYKNLIGITATNVSIINHQQDSYQFSGYVGMFFPLLNNSGGSFSILIPYKSANGMAKMASATIAANNAALLPLKASPANFARLFKALQARPYGWGSVGFHTDCSAEVKSIYTMFGFFMPRNSRHQREAGKLVDLSNLSGSARLNYLIKNGDPLFTLVRLKGHILIYLGAYKYSDGTVVAMSYQQMWGLAPSDRSSRSVVGQAVFLPLLPVYPEDSTLLPELDYSLFELVFLDQLPNQSLQNSMDQLMY